MNLLSDSMGRLTNLSTARGRVSRDANGHAIHVNQNDGRGGLVVYWETSDSAVATIEGSDATEGHNTGATATVTAVEAGSATITARQGVGDERVSNTATVTVTVSN